MMTEHIALGRHRFAVPPLKLRQLRLLLDALAAMEGRSGGALIQAAAQVIHAGIVNDHPDLTIEAVLDLEATMDEINHAVATVIRVAGLVPRGDAAGEAMPATPQAASPAFTAPSPPAAAMPTRSSTE